MLMKIKVKTIVQYIIPLIISVGLCYYLYADMNWADVTAGLSQCRWEWMVAWLAVNLAVIWFRAARWRIQLRVIGVDPPMSVMIRSIMGTYAVNLVFPRLGEVWRSGYVAKRQRADFTPVFGSMVADRLSDTISVILITALTVIVAREPMAQFVSSTDFGRKMLGLLSSAPALIAYGLMSVGVAVLLLFKQIRFIARIRAIIANVWRGFLSIFHMRHAWLWLLLTIGIWYGYYVGTLFSFLAFPATETVFAAHGQVAVLVTFVFGSWAMAVPSNGGIGPWQMAVILALSGIYGLPHGAALAFATIILALQTLLFVILGLYTFVAIALKNR